MKLQIKISLAILPLMAVSIFALGFFSIQVTSTQYTRALTQSIEEELHQYVEHHVMGLHAMLLKNGLDQVDSFVTNYQQQALKDAKNLHHTQTAHFLIIDDNRKVRFCSNHSLHELDDGWISIVKRFQDQPDQLLSIPPNFKRGSNHYIGYHFSPWRWTLAYELPSENLWAPGRKIRNLTLAVAAVCTLLGFLVIAWILKRMVVDPVSTLSEATGAIAANQTVAHIPVQGAGELGGLARNMEHMAGAIGAYRKEQAQWHLKLEKEIADQTEELRASLDLLHKSEQFLSTVLESIQDGICVLDPDLRVVMVNGAVKQRYPQIKKFKGLNYTELQPVVRNEKLCPARKALRSGTIEHDEVQTLLPDGQTGIMEIHAFPITEKQGRVSGVVQYSRDITERKRMEQQILEASELNEKIITASSLGIAAYAYEGECILANSAAADTVGASLEKYKQRNFRKIEPWAESGLLDQALNVLEDGQQRKHEIHVTSSFGKEIWLNCQMARFYRDGQAHLLLMFEDITNRKQLEKELQNNLSELEAANRRITDHQDAMVEEERLKALLQMAGATAHELNQPLMALLGNIELMAINRDDSEKMNRHILKVQQSGERIVKIVRKIQTIRSEDTKAYTQRVNIIDLNMEEE